MTYTPSFSDIYYLSIKHPERFSNPRDLANVWENYSGNDNISNVVRETAARNHYQDYLKLGNAPLIESPIPIPPDPPFDPSSDISRVAQLCPCKTENIIIVGSEMDYNSFWLKMMFMSPAFAVAQGRIPPPEYSSVADRTSVLYVNVGYVRSELLALDYLRDNLGTNIVQCNNKSDVLNHLRTRNIDGETYKIKNLVVFSHGLPGYFALNYSASPRINLFGSDFERLPNDIFDRAGRVFSYACRTAVESSYYGTLGQKIADHFNVEVRAYHRRTDYGEVLRARSKSSAISAALGKGRASNEGSIIDIPPDHQGLPHAGLAETWHGWSGAEGEGTAGYALWRINGARQLPQQGSSPESEPTGFARIRPA